MVNAKKSLGMLSNTRIEVLCNEINEAGFYADLIAQLNKDLLRSGVAQSFEAAVTVDSLNRQLVALLYVLITTNIESYLKVLYIIDVKESVIQNLPAQEASDLAQTVTVLIIEREWQKLKFRNKL